MEKTILSGNAQPISLVKEHVPGPYADVRKRGCELKEFYKAGCESLENFDFEAKIRGVNSVSGEKLHDFKILTLWQPRIVEEEKYSYNV